MTPLDHAAAHERIGDLALERRLSALPASTVPEDVALLAHVATCDECRAELDDLHVVQTGLTDALARANSADVERIAAPPEMRAAVLAQVHKERGAAVSSGSVRGWRLRMTGFNPLNLSRPGLNRLALSLAAALAVIAVVAGAFFVGDENARIQSAEADRRTLAAAIAAVTRVMADPSPSVDALIQPDGVTAGTVAWSRHDLVVLAEHLPAPSSGAVYRCWVVGDATETAVGKMDFVDGEAFWVGSLDGWASIDLATGYQFLVTLEPAAAGTQQHSGPVVLEATLGA